MFADGLSNLTWVNSSRVGTESEPRHHMPWALRIQTYDLQHWVGLSKCLSFMVLILISYSSGTKQQRPIFRAATRLFISSLGNLYHMLITQCLNSQITFGLFSFISECVINVKINQVTTALNWALGWSIFRASGIQNLHQILRWLTTL